jgi:hypothetical protein
MDEQHYVLYRLDLAKKNKYNLISILKGKSSVNALLKTIPPKQRKFFYTTPTSKKTLDEEDKIITKNRFFKKYKQKIKFYKNE